MSSSNINNNNNNESTRRQQTQDAAASSSSSTTTTTRQEAFRRFHAEISAPSRHVQQRSAQQEASLDEVANKTQQATRKAPPLRPPRPPPPPPPPPSSSSSSSPAAAAAAAATVASSTAAAENSAGAASSPSPIPLATEPTLEPYIGRLERFELFSTNQCYYIVGSNKLNTAYRIIKIDRTLIERAPEQQQQQQQTGAGGATTTPQTSWSTSPQSGSGGSNNNNNNNNNLNTMNMNMRVGMSRGDSNISAASITASVSGGGGAGGTAPTGTSGDTNNNNNSLQGASEMAENSHTAKPTLRPLSDFLTEDPNVYTQEEIKDVLDMIHDGNRMTTNTNTTRGGGGSGNVLDRSMSDSSSNSNINNTSGSGASGGLKPIVKAYGLVGFIRFLDCYYLTLITKRAKVGSIGSSGCGVYTIKNTETIPLKPAERVSAELVDDLDPSSVLLSMWSKLLSFYSYLDNIYIYIYIYMPVCADGAIPYQTLTLLFMFRLTSIYLYVYIRKDRGKRSVGLGLSNREIAELRYQGLYQVVDLSKSFFFSYTYGTFVVGKSSSIVLPTCSFPDGLAPSSFCHF
jgi:hypothetical protein